jgi:hypothetical protein
LALRRAPGAATPHLKRAFADLAREPERIGALRAAAEQAGAAYSESVQKQTPQAEAP